ncbi:ion transporter [Prosthecomicrobium sp. N25]|uniref:ion transporter n=1 Tax=Prosthecomicrobium sp. N25 TaxID=3129254 RepID=UPI003077A001
MKDRAAALLADRRTERLVTALIVVNAVTLGLETSPNVMAAAGPLLVAIDQAILAAFVVELTVRLWVQGLRFFRDPWNVFDFVVVAIALVPASGPLAILRALRILRILRLITVVPSLKRVVGALLGALPGMGSIILLLGIIFYVGAVMATKLFGAGRPDEFGTIGASIYTLFQVMTLDGWSSEVVRPVMENHPYAWLFFIPFILASSFIALNLFIGVVVNAMQSEHDAVREEAEAAARARRDDPILAELRALRGEVAELRARLAEPVR